jgi:EAL domain-containing protein (putative c-di-GMP-specific phosphodiesterase class I)
MTADDGRDPEAPQHEDPGHEDPGHEEPAAAEELRTFLRLAPKRPQDEQSDTLNSTAWLLESIGAAGKEIRRMPIPTLPFRIGRKAGLELVLPSDLISKAHAEIYQGDGSLRVRDLDSLNGTFLNRKPVRDEPIADGDVLHVGDFEFRIVRRTVETRQPGRDTSSTAAFDSKALSHFFPQGTKELETMLSSGNVAVVLQPIVRFPSGTVVAYEALGRGSHPDLPEDPLELFRIAEFMGGEIALARLFRRRAVELSRSRPSVAALFLNTHPAELQQPGLVESLEELRILAPRIDLILEIHESALAQPAVMAKLQKELSEINVAVAYDDFGTGQARLLELAEVPPHYLKFDQRFVTGIDQAPPSRRRLLSSLVAAARELHVKTVAEGVETAAEADICERVGFTLGQGYHFGRPVSVDEC